MGVYFDYCEKLDNKSVGVAAMELAKKTDGVLESTYRIKYKCGRRHAKGPAPALMDKGTRAVAMYGSLAVDMDQENSAICVVLHFAIILAMKL